MANSEGTGKSDLMQRVDAIVAELLTAVGCATLAAVPGALLAYAIGFDSRLGALIAGIAFYAVFTSVHLQRMSRVEARLRERLAEAEKKLAESDGPPAQVIDLGARFNAKRAALGLRG